MASEKESSSSRHRLTSGKRVAAKAVPRDPTQPSKSAKHFAICVRNDDYPASLELRKLYPVLEDKFASEHGLIRVIDESGEDYLFPIDYFVHVSLPLAVEKQLQEIA